MGTIGKETMTAIPAPGATLLTPEVRALVELAAQVAAGTEAGMRAAVARAAADVRVPWVEEVILQSYLFAGFPRALNAMREWRKACGVPAETEAPGETYASHAAWESRGTATCATVYGRFYEALRRNIRDLHPALDAWMVVEGYGKVLSRPALPLRERELCIVAACAGARQDRQLHSHLHGALNAGAEVALVRAVLQALAPMLGPDDLHRYLLLLDRVAASDVR